MPNEYNSDTFSSVYKDDFDPNKHFHRILFNSGRALQARELTQLQTIIQEEIARLGSHLFKEGSAVKSGNIDVTEYEYIRLDAGTVIEDEDQVIGATFTGGDSTVEFVVNNIIQSTNDNPITLDVTYINTAQSSADNDNPIRVNKGENITTGEGNSAISFTVENLVNTPAAGEGTKVSVQAGDFFIVKHFVRTDDVQIGYLDLYETQASGEIGFKVLQDIITTSDDDTLYDNQGVTPNLASPGADRYRIRLELYTRTYELNSETGELELFPKFENENIIPIALIRNGEILTEIKDTAQIYNELDKQLARRTYEESGNYIVDKFLLETEDNIDDTKVDLVVSKGVAYVNGFRAATGKDTILTIDKPQTTIVKENQSIPANFGNFYNIYGYDGSDPTLNSHGLPIISNFEVLELKDDVNGAGNTLGTTRIRSILEDGNNLRFYMFDFKMNTGALEANVRSLVRTNISGDPIGAFNVILENNKAVRKNVSANDLLFELPQARAKAVQDNDIDPITVQNHFDVELDSTNIVIESGKLRITIDSSSPNRNLTDDFLWVGALASGESYNTELLNFERVDPNVVNQSSIEYYVSKKDGTGWTFNDLDAKTLHLAYYEVISSPTIRSKTYTVRAEHSVAVSPSEANTFILGHADVISINSITDDNGNDISSNFTFDNGQRDNYYMRSRLIDDSETFTSINVSYNYFAHGASGDFFAVDSYVLSNDFKYEDIPTYTREDGTKIRLSDTLDFRSVQDANEEYIGSTAKLHYLPRPAQGISLNIEYYLPQNGKIYLTENGNVKIILGEPAEEPKMPQSPSGTLDLYLLELAPYMINSKDLAVTPVEAKRYTMKDIGALEERLQNLEETTRLTLLELQTSTYEVLDENGDIRSKSGFFTDSFIDQSKSDLDTREYRASIDPSRALMRPSFATNATGLYRYTPDNANNTKIGDNVYLPVLDDMKSYIKQEFITGTENVNPYAVTTKRGIIVLSPARDVWMETRYSAVKAVEGDDKFSVNQQSLWDNWNWNWTGNEKIGETLGTQRVGASTTWGRTTRGALLSSSSSISNRIITTTNTFQTSTTGIREVSTAAAIVSGISTINETIDENVISTTLLPKMRSQMIYFKASGLKPNTKVFPFFGKKDVTQWCRNEPAFILASDDTEDWTKGYEDAIEHPNGQSQLITNSEGECYGSFFLPMTDNISFTSGRKEFRLIDVNEYNSINKATSWASTTYTSKGREQLRQKTVLSTRVVEIDTEITTERERISVSGQEQEQIQRRDPLAQTFMVEEKTGVFLSAVKVNFTSYPKNNSIPVYLQIRPVVNGYPSSNEVIPSSTVTLSKTTIADAVDNGNGDVIATFDEPVYLLGNNTEYAIVLISDSNHYNVSVAEQGEFLKGSNSERLRRQPSMGSLFKSQNGRTWTADQTKDLTFELYRMQFDTSGTLAVVDASTGRQSLRGSNLFTNFGARYIEPEGPNNNENNKYIWIYDRGHGHNVGDTVLITKTYADKTAPNNWEIGGGIFIDDISNNTTGVSHIVAYADKLGYAIKLNKEATAALRGPGDKRFNIDNQYKFNVGMLKASMIKLEDTEVNIEGKFVSYDPSTNTKTVDTSYRPLQLDRNIYFENEMMCASGRNDNDTDNRSISINFHMQSVNDYVSPVIDMQNMTFGMIHNVINNDELIFEKRDETHPRSGSAVAKHVTKPIVLAQSAIGLKVLLSANKPTDCDFELYYRTNKDKSYKGGNLKEQWWILDTPELEQPSDDNPNNFREYTYLIDETQEFDQFQIKIVMKSSNTSKVPMFKDLRVIALFD